jgi:hypothetical protein
MRLWRDWPDWITFPIIGLLCIIVPLAVGIALSLLQIGGGWTLGVAGLIALVAYLLGIREGRRVERRAHEVRERSRAGGVQSPSGPAS